MKFHSLFSMGILKDIGDIDFSVDGNCCDGRSEMSALESQSA
jgi:uncharacterized protein (DUF779 family)